MDLDDTDRLRHIRADARMVLERYHGESFDDFARDRFKLDAYLTRLQNIGEAARMMSDIGRASVPGVPWSKIIRLRHRLVHDYYEVDPWIIFLIITEHVRPLLKAVERALYAREAD